MPQKPTIRFFESKNGYYTNHERVRHRLGDAPDDSPTGPNYLAALKRFGEIMKVGAADTANQANAVRVVVDLYRQLLERNNQKRTLEILHATCTSAVAEFGDRSFTRLKPIHVTNWLAKMAEPPDQVRGRHGGRGRARLQLPPQVLQIAADQHRLPQRQAVAVPAGGAQGAHQQEDRGVAEVRRWSFFTSGSRASATVTKSPSCSRSPNRSNPWPHTDGDRSK